MKLKLISFLAEIRHFGLYEGVNTLLRITGLNLKLAEVHTTSLAEQPLSHPKECVLNSSKAFICPQPDPGFWSGRGSGLTSTARLWRGGEKKMSVGAVRTAVLQQEQMSPLNGPSWWPSRSGNTSPFAPNQWISLRSGNPAPPPPRPPPPEPRALH